MAEAPVDRGGDDTRRPEINSKVYDPANPNVYYNDPASKNALARRVLEDRSRARAIRGVEFGEEGTALGGGSVLTGQADGETSLAMEDLHDLVQSTQSDAPVDRYSKDDKEKMSTVEKQLSNDGMGSRTEDEETEAKKAKIRRVADKVAGRKLRNVRKADSKGGSRARAMVSRRDILDDPKNMGVTDYDVRELLEDLDGFDYDPAEKYYLDK